MSCYAMLCYAMLCFDMILTVGTFGWVRRARVRRLRACGQRGRPRWRVKHHDELPSACIMFWALRTSLLFSNSFIFAWSALVLIIHTGSL